MMNVADDSIAYKIAVSRGGTGDRVSASADRAITTQHVRPCETLCRAVPEAAKRLLPALFALWIGANPVIAAGSTQLVSLVGIKLAPLPDRPGRPGQYISAFDIKTWAVRVLAVCHIPVGWTITAGKNANPEGVLSGSAGEGVAFIDAGNLTRLSNLFLVEIDDYHKEDRGDCAHGCTPATFAGHVYVGTYGSDVPETPLRIQPANIHLTPASKCSALEP